MTIFFVGISTIDPFCFAICIIYGYNISLVLELIVSAALIVVSSLILYSSSILGVWILIGNGDETENVFLFN